MKSALARKKKGLFWNTFQNRVQMFLLKNDGQCLKKIDIAKHFLKALHCLTSEGENLKNLWCEYIYNNTNLQRNIYILSVIVCVTNSLKQEHYYIFLLT